MKHDQLNRLLEARSYTDGLNSNQWSPTVVSDKYHNKFTYDANGNILTQLRRNSTGAMLDSLTYHYLLDDNGNLVRNRLYHVNDSAGFQNAGDLTDQGTFVDTSYFAVENNNNYKYDEEGRLIQDLAEGIENIVWRVDGKVKKVIFTSVSGKNNLEFDYDAFGRRIAKHVFDQSNNLVKTMYYLLDASGNLMNVMEHTVTGENSSFTLKERNIYGSSVLGLNKHEVDLLSTTSNTFVDGVLGEKFYNLSNHLGNVLTTISDIKVPESSDNVSVTSYRSTIINTYDYSPFGVMLDGRTQENEFVRYGFQSWEKDDEIKGSGNHLSFGDYGYDPRLGRRWNIDPKASKYPDLSPYHFTGNNPIRFVDFDGEDFGVKINHTDKTIVIVANVYTTSAKAYRQALKSAGAWNAKSATSGGYTVTFQMKVNKPFTVSESEVVGAFGTVDFYRKNGKLKKNLYSKYESALVRDKTLEAAESDPIGNSYAGNNGINSRNVSGSTFTGGQTMNGRHADMNTHDERGDMGESEGPVTHEFGHFFGLDDKGGSYYPGDGGIMQYTWPMNSISDDDVNSILNYAKDYLGGKVSGSNESNVKLLENTGSSDGSNPVGVTNKADDE